MSESSESIAIRAGKYPYQEKGPRSAPTMAEVRAFARGGGVDGGRRGVPAAASRFQKQFVSEITSYPESRQMPRWVLALVEKKVSVQEFAQTVYERTLRAPSEENQQLALLLANEIARWDGGSAILQRYVTPELLDKIGAVGGDK